MIKPRFKYLLLACWILGGIYLGAHWVGPHMFAMKTDPSTLKYLLPAQQPSQTRAVHILGENCDCSNLVGQYLAERKNLLGQEQIVFIGYQKPSLMTNWSEAGFDVQWITPNDLSEELSLALPTFVIQNNKSQVIYSGGYSSSKLTSKEQVLDQQIWGHFLEGRALQELPIFGCVTQKKYEAFLNPTALKLKRTANRRNP